MSLKGQNVLITGASKGIGASIAKLLAQHGANLVLTARSNDALVDLTSEIFSLAGTQIKVEMLPVDVRSYDKLRRAVSQAVQVMGPIDVLINNAGLAIGAPATFADQDVEAIDLMVDTNIKGYMWAAHAALNQGGMLLSKRGTIINVTSVTGLEVPPFPGEAVYHTSKAAQEAFTNVLRTELKDTNIRVLALRPGVVATHFHQQRVGYDKNMYNEFMEGFEPLLADEVAQAALFMLSQGEKVSVKALDVVPTAQRTLQVFDRNWNERHGIS